MSTIPAETVVNILPSVLGAGGNALALNGMFLTLNTRVPIGTVLSFPTAAAVSAFFGPVSTEALEANVYFNGFTGRTATPGAMLFAQYPQSAVSAYLRGSSVAALTLAQIQALNGSIGVVADGFAHGPSNVNLAAASSFSAAAALIQTGLNAGLATLATFNASIAGTTMTVTGGLTGTITPGLAVSGSTTVPGTVILSQLGGSVGGTGTYQLSIGQIVNGTLSGSPAPVAVSFDSVSGAFVITSGAFGSPSTMAYATGSLSTSLGLTQALGAVLSQGANAATPGAFMTSLVTLARNWALFTTLFNPDSVVGVNTNKLAFALWNSQQSQRYGYVPADTDPTPTLSNNAPTSLGAEIAANGYGGVCPVWESGAQRLAAFVLGTAAAIDFTVLDGRITFAFKSQAGLVPGVTDPTVAANLQANGYSYYGAYATANAQFQFFNPGSVSGPFAWLDSYVNQIWLNSQFQLTLVQLLTTLKAIPYTPAGYTLVQNALATPIQAGLNFGAFSAGVTLSSSQIAEVNTAAGANVAPTIQQQGFYLQVKDPGPAARAVRGSPIINFWYADGEAIQSISMASIALQ